MTSDAGSRVALMTAVFARLRDRASVELRSVQPSDRAGLAALFWQMSPLSVHHRYFGAVSEPELEWLDRLAPRDIAIVAVEAGRIVGLGRAVATGPMQAELAFDVGDRDQHRGIGTLLFHELARLARLEGIASFTAEIEPGNAAMLDVLEHVGCALRTTSSRDGIHAELSLCTPVT